MAAAGLNPAPPAPRAGGGGGLNGSNALRDGCPMTRLGHVALRVQDMARASAFYQALGLRVTWQAEDWTYLQSTAWPCSARRTPQLAPISPSI